MVGNVLENPIRKVGIKVFLALVCAVLSSIAHASTILTLDGNFAAPDYAFYTYTDVYGVAHDSIPVDPYIATSDGGTYNNASVFLFCYDLNSPTEVATPYSGSIESVTEFSGPAFTALMEATYLLNELNEDGMLNAPLATRGAISMAIWEIMNPSSSTASTQFPTDPAAGPYELEAANAVSYGSWTIADAADWPTWVPDNPEIQRFGVVVAGAPPVPEPGTMVLAGLGLIVLGCFKRKRRA
jgi:hypothetical protein